MVKSKSAVTVGRLTLDNYAAELDSLTAMSVQEEYLFLQYLQAEWIDGVNWFDQPHEVLLGEIVDGELVGVCGINHDPYSTDKAVARLRHLYVGPAYRSKCIGYRLTDACIEMARLFFSTIRLWMAREEKNLPSSWFSSGGLYRRIP